MAKWKITSDASGADLGVYEGDTAGDALDAMAREAGYGSHSEACAVTGDDGRHLRVTRVEDDALAHA